jgi:hypothetical protein
MQIDSSGPGATAVTGADARAAPRNHLVYAAPVHQLSLVVAARAWPRVQRAYRFIDLILARRRRGTLAVDKMATSPAPRPRLPDLPAEIWLHIKHYIAFELFSEAQDHFFFEAHGFEDNMLWHELEDPDDAKFIPRIGRARLDCDHLKQCLECQYDIFSTQGRAYAISTNAKVRAVPTVLHSPSGFDLFERLAAADKVWQPVIHLWSPFPPRQLSPSSRITGSALPATISSAPWPLSTPSRTTPT